jgi:hypothetical protein
MRTEDGTEEVSRGVAVVSTERELGLHIFPKLILVVELPNTNN